MSPENEDQITHIDAEVLRIDEAVEKLLNQRIALNRKRNALVPAVNLPQEILTIIFVFACSASSIAKAEKSQEPKQTPDYPCTRTVLLIANVCSVWRNIAFGASQLWTNITIGIKHEKAKALAAMLQYWLSKFDQRPLNVQLTEQYDCDTYESTALIDILVAHAHRLHTLDLFLPRTWEPALNRIVNCMPLLTRLTMCQTRVEYGNRMQRPIDMFANAPQLREVTLLGYEDNVVALPWAQLESLGATYSNEFKCLETLRLCPRLRRFTVELFIYEESITTMVAPMTHSALEVLEVSGTCEIPVPGILGVLALPALRSFGLEFEFLSKWGPWLPQFISRVADTLENLSLCVPPENEEFLATLRAVPRLRKLAINAYSYNKLSQRVLDAMNPKKYERLGSEGMELLDSRGCGNGAGALGADESNNWRCLVPNLETLDYKGDIAFNPHALVEFLVARWSSHSASSELEGPVTGLQMAGESLAQTFNAQAAKMRSVTFTTPTRIQFEVSDWAIVQRLRREGMHLEFLEF